MKKTFFVSCCLIAALFMSNSLKAQTIDKETIILDDKNQENKTTIEIENGNVYVDGKKVASTNQKGKKVTIIKKKTINDVDDDIDVPFSFKSNRALLGVRTQDGAGGAEIMAVVPHSAADKAGLKEGDIITKLDAQTIQSAQDVVDYIGNKKVGDLVNITIDDGKNSRQTTATLGQNEDVQVQVFDDEDFPLAPFLRQLDLKNNFRRFDMPMSSTNTSPAFGLEVEEGEQGGLEVVDVLPNSLAEKAQFQRGDIIRKIENESITSPQDFKRNALKYKSNKSFEVTVERNGQEKNLSMEFPKMRRRVKL